MIKHTLLAAATAAIALLGASANVTQAATAAARPCDAGDAQRRPDPGPNAPKTRAQVRAETLEAIRLGLVFFGDGGPPTPTAEQLERIRLAGLCALTADNAVGRR